MRLNRDEKVGVVLVRQYGDKHDCRFEMESSCVGFSIFRTITCEENELDPEVIREWWFRFKFWAHAIDTIRCPFMAQIAKTFL